MIKRGCNFFENRAKFEGVFLVKLGVKSGSCFLRFQIASNFAGGIGGVLSVKRDNKKGVRFYVEVIKNWRG